MDYFIQSNGASGHVDFIDSEFGNLKKWIKLYDYPRKLAAELIQKIAERAEKEGKAYDVIHHCFDTIPEGIIVDGTGLLSMPFSKQNEVSVSQIFDRRWCEDWLQKAYACFERAKKTHDDWEQIYIHKTNFNRLNQLTEEVIEKLIGEKQLSKRGIRKDRFFGAATVDGSIDYIEQITSTIEKRYFIKGRPGTGKSTFLRKIAQYALDRGYDVEVYHCAFDPGSLDMIILRELNLCIFDSTAPHEYFPTREQDEIIDVYEIAIEPGTDEKFADQLNAISSDYQKEIQEAIKFICEAKKSSDEADEWLLSLLNPAKVEATEQKLIEMMFE